MFTAQISCRNLFVFAYFLFFIFISAHPVSVSAETVQAGFEPLKKKLVKDGFDKALIDRIYSARGVFFDTKSVSAFFLHKESTLNYDQFVKAKPIRMTQKYLQKYEKEFSNAEKKYGVDKNIIAAIILVETRLGASTGKSSVINTLSTMASLSEPDEREYLWKCFSESGKLLRENFNKKAAKKSRWGYRELKAFIQYTTNEKINPEEVYGSYAGALGIAQFLPSNILILGIDGDKDGRIDLFEHTDAIFSIANYLKHSGWKAGIGEEQAAKVVYRYNHSKYYVNTILKIARILDKKK